MTPEELAALADQVGEGAAEAEARRRRFAQPYGRSSLYPGRRVFPCPTCGKPHRLTAADRRHGYQCDDCADRDEAGGW